MKDVKEVQARHLCCKSNLQTQVSISSEDSCGSQDEGFAGAKFYLWDFAGDSSDCQVTVFM